MVLYGSRKQQAAAAAAAAVKTTALSAERETFTQMADLGIKCKYITNECGIVENISFIMYNIGNWSKLNLY